MKFKELTTKSEAEIRQMLADLRQQAHDLLVKTKLNQLKTTHQIADVRKDIARILTFLKQKQAK